MMLRTLANMYAEHKNNAEETKYRQLIESKTAELPDTAALGSSSQQRKTSAAPPRPVCGCVREDCRGFVMSATWKCGVCTTKVCSSCLKEEGDTHKCNTDDVETRKLLLANTKPCPKCGVMISKVDGCNQMWCVMCHTTFDWRSGEIVKGHVHNPHYFEWMRRNGREIARNPLDQPPPQQNHCGEGLVPMNMFVQYINTLPKRKTIINMYRLVVHINAVVIDDIDRSNPTNSFNRLRESYLLQKISEEGYKMELVRTDRYHERLNAERQIAALFVAEATEKIRDMYNTRSSDPSAHMTEMKALRTYCNEQFKRVARAYQKGRWYTISPDMSEIRKTNVTGKEKA